MNLNTLVCVISDIKCDGKDYTTLLPVGELGSCSIRLCGCQHWTNAKLYQMSLEDLASHIDHGPWNITHTQQYRFELNKQLHLTV